MVNFIKCTPFMIKEHAEPPNPVYINAKKIVSIVRTKLSDRLAECTEIYTGDQESYHVIESPETIINLIKLGEGE